MANIDLQFEEFMKEPLSNGESPDSNPSSRHDVKEIPPEPRKFWWMKEKPQSGKISTETASNRSSFSGASGDGARLEGGYGTISPAIKNISIAKVPAAVSPDVSSSMADFLEKEKLCKELSISDIGSPAMEFPGDDGTDDDIGSIMEQLSQLAGSTDDSAADKSVEEILKEAEELVRETSHTFSGFLDSSALLKSPVTPGLVIRSRSANLVRASSDSKHFMTEGKGKEDQSSINRPSTAPTILKRINNKSAGRKMGDRGEQHRGSAVGSVHLTSEKTDIGPGVEKISSDKFGDSRQVAVSDIHENIGARSDDGYIDIGSVMSGTKSAKRLGNYSGKDLPKKEKTVTFENGFSLFPKSVGSINKKHKSLIDSSGQKLCEHETTSEGKSDEMCNKDDSEFALKTVTLQPGTERGLFASGEAHGDRLSEVLPVSPPLIQHGDAVGTPEAIFQLIDNEVSSEIVVALQESQKYPDEGSDHPSLNVDKQKKEMFDRSKMIHTLDSIGISFPKKPLSIVQEESSVSESSLGESKLKDASTVTERKQSSDRCVQVTDTSLIERVATLEKDLLQERSVSSQLKNKLESGEQEHKRQLAALKCKHEEEIFTLKKEVYIVNAKVMDLEKGQESSATGKEGDSGINDGTAKEHLVTLLDAELQQQERLMLGYQRENIKLCQEMKQLKEELKAKDRRLATQRQRPSLETQGQAVERLTEQLRDKDEAILRLQVEVQSLQEKNVSLERDAEHLKLITTALRVKLEKHKCVPATAAAPAPKVTPRNDEPEDVRKEAELEKIRKESETARKETETAKAEAAERKLQVEISETKVSELQAMLTKEHSQTLAHSLRAEEDKRKIQDLSRQVKEMERILKRNHPNSISALILTANSEGTEPSPRFRYLENRVQQLEQELARNEADAQVSVKEIQEKFHTMKLKYEEHTSDLELQLAGAKHQAHMWRQAAEKRTEEQPVREVKQNKKTAAAPVVIAVGAPPANALAVREDAHLLATIRGLKLELAAKDRELLKIRRDLDESAKINRRLQRERERQLDVFVAPPRPPAVRGAAKQQEASETSQWSGNRMYDPARFEPSIPGQKEDVERLKQENGVLREELLHLEEDYRSLQTKRLQDLNLLQEQHEVEMDRLISDYMARHSNSRIADLQGQLSTQQIIISHLKDQLKQLDEYQEEIEVLKAERDHLERSNVDLRKKVSDFQIMQTPEMLQYEVLQGKLSELEQRHETREQKLQAVVRHLLQRNAEQRAVTGGDGSAAAMKEKLLDKNRQLCSYRAEMDRILETLKEFGRHRNSGSAVHLTPG